MFRYRLLCTKKFFPHIPFLKFLKRSVIPEKRRWPEMWSMWNAPSDRDYDEQFNPPPDPDEDEEEDGDGE